MQLTEGRYLAPDLGSLAIPHRLAFAIVSAPRELVWIAAKQTRPRIHVQRLPDASHAEEPPAQIDEVAIDHACMYGHVLVQMFQDVSLHGIAAVDDGAHLAVHLVPRATNLPLEVTR